MWTARLLVAAGLFVVLLVAIVLIGLVLGDLGQPGPMGGPVF
jgi:hypothetical protein